MMEVDLFTYVDHNAFQNSKIKSAALNSIKPCCLDSCVTGARKKY